jgi:hypothetical protein
MVRHLPILKTGSPSSQRPARYTDGWKALAALYSVSGVDLTL